MSAIRRASQTLLALVACAIIAPAQTSVTFTNSRFMVNGQPFFPIGWYGGERPSALDSLRTSGCNVVLSYWNSVIDAYGRGSRTYDLPTYHRALLAFLDSAWYRRIRVIVNIPRTDVNLVRYSHTELLSNVDSLVGDSAVKNHPALLGWYVYDEPEIEPGHSITIQDMHTVYTLIKQLDPLHPVFTATGAPLANEFNRLFPSPADSASPYRDSLFYDVLMVDHYPFYRDEKPPAGRLAYIDTWAPRHAERFWKERQFASPGALMIVAQGSGPNAGDLALRYPTMAEMMSQFMLATYKLQHGANGDLAGVLYFHWDGLNGRNDARDSVLRLIQFITANHLDAALGQPNLNKLCQTSYAEIKTMIRRYDGFTYVFGLNDGMESMESVSITVDLGAGKDALCQELEMPLGKSTAKTLTRRGQSSYQFVASFKPRECRVYRLTVVQD